MCTLCRQVSFEIKGLEKRYYRCPNCDLFFLDPECHLSPEEEKERYTLHDNTCENKGYVAMFRRFIRKAVEPYKDTIRNALDYGCGPGPVLKVLLEDMGIKTDIYDPYFFPSRVFQDKQYDLITCTEVLEHIADPLEAFNTFTAYLKVGGILALMTRFRPPMDEFKEWWYRQDPTHVSFYSVRTFEWLARHFPLRLRYIDNRDTCVFEKVLSGSEK
ncbi:MAG: class I SAM-dependent methyltransferase [Peptococcaceae bacterium]|nr:class I SAM-dependent methyltransferase [Peptococcaceae bacterium]